MDSIAYQVNWLIRAYYRGQPIPHSLMLAMFAAQAVIDGTFGIRNVTQAAIVLGINRAAVDNAHVLLLSGNTTLINAVSDNVMTLAQAAAKERGSVQIFQKFKAASAGDRARFGRLAGPGAVFDDAVMAAL